ncbi:TPA: hypothetical protein N0F65_002943 [Lagenidium giganteum]|uniref:Cyclic nucleotide-binding domain-containing protein n=1 Tax=Lagenidium giganteum TaxID=4803 RepID=A0AAV2Z8T3_9STRA|nr:TPA: hypothetical protein N0F65_002943 [Lagenidium giganteum]
MQTVTNKEPPEVVATKGRLLLAALEKPLRLRTDLDIAVIVQYLLSLESLLVVSLPTLHYIASECSLMKLRDGDVLCYQEDAIRDESCAFVIMEGSLCGYYNKAFSQRANTSENFQIWNSKQARKRGVLIDFGDIQATYSSGGTVDFVMLSQNLPSPRHPSLTVVATNQDTLDRVRRRFALTYEKGCLQTKESAFGSEYAHLGLWNQLTEPTRQALFLDAPRRHLKPGEVLFNCTPLRPPSVPVGDAQTLTAHCSVNAFVVILFGRLDIHWMGYQSVASTSSPGDHAADGSNTSAETDGSNNSAAAFAKYPLVSLRRGQTFGEQAIGLDLERVFSSRTLCAIQVVAAEAEAATEIVWISKDQYEDALRADRARFAYVEQLQLVPFPAWATTAFFPQKTALERTPADLAHLTFRLLADTRLQKFFFQFPPTVLERLTQCLELRAYGSAGPLFAAGDQIDELLIVVRGSLRVLGGTPSAKQSVEALTVQHVMPGDAFGVDELLDRYPLELPLYVDADTLLLALPSPAFNAWIAPLVTTTIFGGGSTFQLFGAVGGMSKEHKRKAGGGWNYGRAGPRSTPSPTPPSSAGGMRGSPERISSLNCATPASSLDPLALALRRMGLYASVPRMLLAELLPHVSLVRKQAGDVVFHEGEETNALVVIASGFLAFYSLESMASAVDMFQGYNFCQFVSFRAPSDEEQAALAVLMDEDLQGAVAGHNASHAFTKNRSSIYGVHVQTLNARNAFRTGILQNQTVCPATVVAQTACELLLMDETTYSEILKHHAPAIDFSECEDAPPAPSAPSTPSTASTTESITAPVNDASSTTPPPRDSRSSLVKAYLKHIELAAPVWLTESPARLQLLLREMKSVHVAPGERIAKRHDRVDMLWIVVSGRLALFVQRNRDASNFLGANQRSVRSLMLERSVTSNYSTTSQQLYRQKNHAGSSKSIGGVKTGASGANSQGSSASGAAGTAASGGVTQAQQSEVTRKAIRTKLTRITARVSYASASNGDAPTAHPHLSNALRALSVGPAALFRDSVLAAVDEHKHQAAGHHAEHGTSAIPTATPAHIPSAPPVENPTVTRASKPMGLLYTAVAKAKFTQRLDHHRATHNPGNAVAAAPTATASGHSAAAGDSSGAGAGVSADSGESLFFCHLLPGDIWGDEILVEENAWSTHDVVADSGAELLGLSRNAFHTILAKSDDDVRKELRVRSKLAKAKWQIAERKVSQRLMRSSLGGPGSSRSPKLFDLFKNILNQRCFLTMRTIADISLLRDLPDASKRELCVTARFEAADRNSNVYRETMSVGLTSSTPHATLAAEHQHGGLRYYFVLSGRVALFAGKSSFAHMAAAAANGTNATVGGGTELCLREVTAGSGFGEFEILTGETTRTIAAVAVEPSKLLSFPAAVFLKHWPHLQTMRSNIEYLRARIPFFSRLELEKISYLYHSLGFQTFARGSKIFEQRTFPSGTQQLVGNASSSATSGGGTSELYLLKEGECSIRQRILLDTHKFKEGSHRFGSLGKSALATRKYHMKVMATIADVSEGHMFWLDSDHFPFTLETVSSSVIVGVITIDKLKAIMPRTQLQALEDHIAQMTALYQQQYELAKRAVVSVMNDKREAEIGYSSSTGGVGTPKFLPSLHFHLQRKHQRSSIVNTPAKHGKDTREHAQSHPDRQPTVPFSRLLASRPIPLEDEAHMTMLTFPRGGATTARSDPDADGGDRAHSPRDSDQATSPRGAHEAEHYILDGPVANSLLFGSFPDDFGLRVHNTQPMSPPRRSTLRLTSEPIATVAPSASCTNTSAGTSTSTTFVTESPAATSTSSFDSLKLDETMGAESTSPLPQAAPVISVPSLPQPTARAKTPPTFGATPMRKGSGRGSRSHLHARQQNLVHLEVVVPVPSAPPTTNESVQLDEPDQRFLKAAPLSLPAKLTKNIQQPFKLATKNPGLQPLASPNEQTQARSRMDSGLIARKQGFLGVLKPQSRVVVIKPGEDMQADDDMEAVDGIITNNMAHSHKRSLFELVENELVEYPENVNLNALPTATCLARHSLQSSTTKIVDALVMPGQNESLLRNSFIVTIVNETIEEIPAPGRMDEHQHQHHHGHSHAPATIHVVRRESHQLVLTAQSAVEKKKWMTSLLLASALGSRTRGTQHGLAVGAHFQDDDAAAHHKRAVIDKWRERRASSLLSVDSDISSDGSVLHVDYRIH